jgi:hypothetical protein
MTRKNRMKRWSAAVLATCVAVSCGCSVGGHHAADSVLEARFFQHRSEFENLLGDMQSDQKIRAVRADLLIYDGHRFDLREAGNAAAIERAGLTKQHLARYQEQLDKLGLDGVIQGHGEVEFRTDKESFSNGDSYKGYVFRMSPPDHTRSSLDGYRISENDKNPDGDWIVYKPLADHWYLYLFVNR